MLAAPFIVLAIPFLACAAPHEHKHEHHHEHNHTIRQDGSQCDTNGVTCCQDTYDATSAHAMTILTALNMPAQGAGTFVGLNCSPVSIVGIGSGVGCNSSPMCCTDEYVGTVGDDMISLDCTIADVQI